MNAFARWLGDQLPIVKLVSKARGPHANLLVGLIADELTAACLEAQCAVMHLTPGNARRAFDQRRPDVLLVESAWQGYRGAWKFRIAAYPDHPDRDNRDLAQLVSLARDKGIPTVFWNKEDGAHFDRFIDSAQLFDAVFTVDSSCIPRYRSVLKDTVRVATLPFAVQPQMHGFSGIGPGRRGANFVGSYSRHLHDRRRERQDMLLPAAASALGLAVFDRNSDRRAKHYRFPRLEGLHVYPKVDHAQTAAIYKSHLVSLNVNTVEDSETMFSRRLVEIMACGGMAVTTPALAINRLFPDLCRVVSTTEEALEIFTQLASDGYSRRDIDMMHAAAEHTLSHHTWGHRIDTILDAIGH